MTFISAFLIPLLAVFALVSASNVNFVNRCGYSVEVIRTANNQQSASEGWLNAGQSFIRWYGGNGMNFKNGWNGRTLAEFTFNGWNNLDFYDLSVIVGYDIGMQISTSTGGPTVTCTYAGCPDAYQYPSDNSKNHGTRTGGTFNVVFCP